MVIEKVRYYIVHREDKGLRENSLGKLEGERGNKQEDENQGKWVWLQANFSV